MAGKTIREAITLGIEEHNPRLGVDRLKLRETILMNLRDTCAHQFMIYSAQATRPLKDQDEADFVNSVIMGLFDRLFAGVPAFKNSTEEGKE